MKRLKFLIAHENPVFRRIVKRRLEREGFETLLAASALEAETLARIETPDVVVAGDRLAPGSLGTRKPLTILVGDDETAPHDALTSALRLTKKEFVELLQLGPLLVAFLLALLQNS